MISLKGLIVAIVVMVTRLKLLTEGKLLIASPKIRTRRNKAKKEPSSPKGPLKETPESPQVPSPSVEI